MLRHRPEHEENFQGRQGSLGRGNLRLGTQRVVVLAQQVAEEAGEELLSLKGEVDIHAEDG